MEYVNSPRSASTLDGSSNAHNPVNRTDAHTEAFRDRLQGLIFHPQRADFLALRFSQGAFASSDDFLDAWIRLGAQRFGRIDRLSVEAVATESLAVDDVFGRASTSTSAYPAPRRSARS